MCFYLSFCSSSKHNIILLLKHGSVEFFSIKLLTMGKSNQKIGKIRNYSCVRKSYSTTRKGIGDRKERVISYSKTTMLTYFDKLKKKQQDQGGRYFCFSIRNKLWTNDYSTISNLRDYLFKHILEQVSSVLTILSSWNKCLIIIYFLWFVLLNCSKRIVAFRMVG